MSGRVESELNAVWAPVTIRDRLLLTVGGMEAFANSFNQRTFSPEKRAASAIDDAAASIGAGLAKLDESGATVGMAEDWVRGYIAKWAKYQHAGARTVNWMITGPARFPVERNRKRMEVEHKRLEELLAYEKDASGWAHRRLRAAERREVVAADAASDVQHKEKLYGDIRVVLNKALDRVQIIFPGKPSDDERAILKSNAFRWAPSVGAWQRQLTQNGVWAAERAMKQIGPAA